MGRRIWIVGILATVLFTIAGVSGYRVEAVSDEILLHLLAGTAAATLLFVVFCWVLLYLLATGPVIRRAVREEGLDRAVDRRARGLQRRGVPWAVAVLITTVGVVAAGGGLFSGIVSTWVHHALFFLGLLLQLGALVVLKKLLDDHEAVVKEVAAGAETSRAETGS